MIQLDFLDLSGQPRLWIFTCLENQLTFLSVRGYEMLDRLECVIQPICAAKNWTIEKVKYNYEPFN